LRRWLSFLVAASILIGICLAAPALERIEGFGEKILALRESGLETGAIFYGQVTKIVEIEYTLLHLRDYNPERNFVGRDRSGEPANKP